MYRIDDSDIGEKDSPNRGSYPLWPWVREPPWAS